MGGTVMRRIAARSALVLAIAAALLTGSCANDLTWLLQTWAGLDMLDVSGGTLTLGDVEGLGNPDELPVHAVTLSPFEMSRYEVTQSLYYAIMGTNPSWFQPANDYTDEPCRPVEMVSWQDAVTFCNTLSRYAGLEPCYTFDDARTTVTWNTAANGYRLPTEAEWEFAARGGNLSFTFAGSDEPSEVAWYVDNTLGGGPHAVGQLGSNELGFYDMSGNVTEWCWDTYLVNYYASIDGSTDPRGPADTLAPINSSEVFVARGGWTEAPADGCRNAQRYFSFDGPSGALPAIGFRVARNP